MSETAEEKTAVSAEKEGLGGEKQKGEIPSQGPFEAYIGKVGGGGLAGGCET